MPNPRCHLTAHAPASISFQNQGFAFTRCRRCGEDLIRSAAAPKARWSAVPNGLRVAWRDSDTTAFVQRSDTQRLWDAMARCIATVGGCAWLATMIIRWWIAEAVRRARRQIAANRRKSRVLVVPGRRAVRDRFVLMITLTMVRERSTRGNGVVTPDTMRSVFSAWRYTRLGRRYA